MRPANFQVVGAAAAVLVAVVAATALQEGAFRSRDAASSNASLNAPPTAGACGSSGASVSYGPRFAASPTGYHVATATVNNLIEKNCTGDTVVVTLESPTGTLASAATTVNGSSSVAMVTFPSPGPLAAQVTRVDVQICQQPQGNGAGHCQQVTP